jgi:tetratricopeptide (TPR) repeat protein
MLREIKGHPGPFQITKVLGFTDGRRFVSTSTDQTASVWNIETGEEIATLRGHSGAITGIAVNRTGTYIFTGSDDGTARIWDSETGRVVSSLSGHHGNVIAIALTSDGKSLVTGSLDGSARIWEAATGVEVSRFDKNEARIGKILITPDDKYVVIASHDGNVQFWKILPRGAELIQAAKHISARCLGAADQDDLHLSGALPQWCTNLDKWPTKTLEAVLVEQGRELLSDLKDAEGDAAFDKAIELYPADKNEIKFLWAKAYLSSALPLILRGDDKEAQTRFDRAIQLDERSRIISDIAFDAILIGRVGALADNRRFEEARKVVKEVYKHNYLPARTLAQGYATLPFGWRGIDNDLADFYQFSLLQDPFAVSDLVEGLIADGKADRKSDAVPGEELIATGYEKAIQWAKENSVEVPRRIQAEAHLARANVLIDKKQWEQAARELSQTLQLDDKDSLAYRYALQLSQKLPGDKQPVSGRKPD